MITITATEAARRFSDLLNRVRYRGESYEVVRGGEVVARLVPPAATKATVRGLFDLLAAHGPADEGLADELERIQAAQQPLPSDPWAT